MSITVERRKVGRLVIAPVADGMKLAVEALEFQASCGCLCIFGLRLDNHEKTCCYAPCPRHEPRGDEFLEHLIAPDGREVETAAWITVGLEQLLP